MSYNKRESGIELLKIVAMFIIVISHVTQSIGRDMSSYGVADDYLINLTHSTTDISQLLLSFFRYFGGLGNSLFFVCSAWFLADSKKINTQKIVTLIVDIWVISIIIFLAFFISGIPMSKEHMIKSFLPTTFSNNWYMTTYILFYAIHVPLNLVIEKMSQKSMLKAVIILSVLYCGFGCIKSELYCGNYLTCFITIYFIVCYMKKYMPRFCDSKKSNYYLLGICTGFILILFIFTNLLGLKISAFSNRLLHWNRNNNILLIFIAISLLNLARTKKAVKPIINYISSLSLLIYIIHENILVSAYIRTRIWEELYLHFGHSCVVLQDIVFSVVLFIATAIIGCVYKNTIMRLTGIFSQKFYSCMNEKFSSIFEKVCKIGS